MRPLELTLQGFRSYRDQATFDLRGRRLIGIVGPIGSGKSSLLDAVSFALFGKTPTFESNTRSLIHQLCDVAHVELVFEVEGQVWRVQRGLRRKGASGHKLQRLALDDPNAEVLESYEQKREIGDRVEQLLGMGFDAYRRSILLAQNRFAEFLQATPGQRNDVLKGVFGYERFDAAQDLARDRVRDAEAELAILDAEGGRLRRAEEERRVAADDAARATGFLASLEEAAPRIEAGAAAQATAENAAHDASERIRTLAALGDDLPPSDRLEAVVRAAEVSEREAQRLQSETDRATEADRTARAELAAIAERVGDRAAFTAFAGLVARLDLEADQVTHRSAELEAAEAGLQEATVALEEANAAQEAAAERARTTGGSLTGASGRVAEAEAAVHEAKHAEMARELRRHLVEGTACPVCEQVVVAAPGSAPPAKVAAAERALAKARTAEEDARRQVEDAQRVAAAAAERRTTAAKAAGRAEQELGQATTRTRAAEAALGATQSELVDRLGEGDPRALLAARGSELEAAETRVEEAAARLTEIRASLDAARREGADAVKALAALANRIATTWGALGRSHPIAADPAGVRLAFIELGEALISLHGEGEKDQAKAEEQARAAQAMVTAELDALGLAPDADFGAERRSAAALRAAADERLRALDTQLAAGSDLAGRIAEATGRRDLARRLASDLQPSRFLAYLLAEERAALAELGSVHLEELTGGAYRFTDDDTFRILDMNAGGMDRSPDSLSGGETFLASLALALGLAEIVTRAGGRLDSFFLDEGFGSLDPEHLDRAMDGIGRLVADDTNRLVVLVSHVELMRQLLEDLIVLDKDERTGDTRVLAGSSPLG